MRPDRMSVNQEEYVAFWVLLTRARLTGGRSGSWGFWGDQVPLGLLPQPTHKFIQK
jgi:hypothetical protein